MRGRALQTEVVKGYGSVGRMVITNPKKIIVLSNSTSAVQDAAIGVESSYDY